MTLVYGNRGCGKTRRLIKWSAKTGGWIFTWSQDSKQFIEYQIRQMGLEGKAHVFSRYDMITHKGPPMDTKISVDEFEDVIENVLAPYSIEEITTTMKKIRLKGGIKD